MLQYNALTCLRTYSFVVALAAYAHAFNSSCMREFVCACMCAPACLCVHAGLRVCVFVRACVRVYARVNVYM